MLILLYGNNIRAEAEPAIAGCRIPAMSPRGSVIPMRGHAPPELAPPGDDAARHARVRRRSTSELVVRGRAVFSLTTLMQS